MVEDSIDEIRRKAMAEIKEKAKKNPKFLHPCSKEFQEDMKRLRFDNGNKYISWMQQNGIMKNPTNIYRKIRENTIKNAVCKTEKEYQDKCAQYLGFKDYTERNRERVKGWRHETGINLPREFNEDCSPWFGEFTENLMIQTFEDAKKMPPNNPGFDWTCKRGDKIDNKSRCLEYSKESNWTGWPFPIRHNNITDWFVLSAWNSRYSLTPLHVWTFHKNDIVRGRKFWNREIFSITNTSKGLKEFEKWEVTDRLDKLKELYNRYKD